MMGRERACGLGVGRAILAGGGQEWKLNLEEELPGRVWLEGTVLLVLFSGEYEAEMSSSLGAARVLSVFTPNSDTVFRLVQAQNRPREIPLKLERLQCPVPTTVLSATTPDTQTSSHPSSDNWQNKHGQLSNSPAATRSVTAADCHGQRPTTPVPAPGLGWGGDAPATQIGAQSNCGAPRFGFGAGQPSDGGRPLPRSNGETPGGRPLQRGQERRVARLDAWMRCVRTAAFQRAPGW